MEEVGQNDSLGIYLLSLVVYMHYVCPDIARSVEEERVFIKVFDVLFHQTWKSSNQIG